MTFISVIENSSVPKYKQIISSVEVALVEGVIKKGDGLPSINSIRNRFSLSRDTVLMAFNELKARGIVESIAGKGYYIKSEDVSITQKIFLLFDELNAFKEDLYNSFLEGLDGNIQVDIYFHHFNQDLFRKLIHDSYGSYNKYIIMPANLENTDKIIEVLPEDKVYILDQLHPELNRYPAIFQNFEDAIFRNLKEAENFLKKYDKIRLLFSGNKQPLGILKGFKRFKNTSKIECDVIENLNNIQPEIGEAYLVLDDKDLIELLKKIKDQKLLLGKDIGMISYNETLLKEIVEGGITTISTDFRQMGKRLAQMILNNETIHVETPNALKLRHSI